MIARLPGYWFKNTGKTQRRVTTVDNGSVSVAYLDYLTGLGMRLVPGGGGENGNMDRLNTQNPNKIYLQGAPDVTATDRIVFDSRVYDILSVNNFDENGTYTRCDCEEVQPSPYDSAWPFDTDFDFPAGNLTGNDGWTTTAGSASCIVVPSEGIRAVDAAVQSGNDRVLSDDGAPSHGGTWYLQIDTSALGQSPLDPQGFLVEIYAADSSLICSIQLEYNTYLINWTATWPEGYFATGIISALTPPPPQTALLSLTSAGAAVFKINGVTKHSTTRTITATSPVALARVTLVDYATTATARLASLYFGGVAP